jgi:hypothetical protein
MVNIKDCISKIDDIEALVNGKTMKEIKEIEKSHNINWDCLYPLIDTDGTCSAVVDVGCTPDYRGYDEDEIVIDASGDYARFATTDEIEYHRQSIENGFEAWPNTVMQ